MPIKRPDFDNLSEADLDELIYAQVPEGQRIEYKRDTYGALDGDRREALKDISSFANTFGGTLLIGIEAQDGVPVTKVGLPGVNVDSEILRLENLARDAIEPRVLGIRTGAIRLTSGERCIVMRIPRSWHVPHRVSAKGHNKYYVRNSNGAHEASVEELRTMFMQSADAAERARQFRDSRIANLSDQRTELLLATQGRAVLHVVPLAGLQGQVQVDMSEAEDRWPKIVPLGASAGTEYRFNLDGLLVTRGTQQLHGYAQLFRNGTIESVLAGLWRDEGGNKKVVRVRKIEASLVEALPMLLGFLQSLDVPPPFAVMLTLEDVSGTIFRAVAPLFDQDPEPAVYENIARLPDVLIADFGTPLDYQRSLRPIFDALWNMAGRAKSETYEEDGTWNARLGRA